MDITPSLSTLLIKTHRSRPIPTESARREVDLERLDGFLKEAYQINTSLTSLLTYLRAIRLPYLSTAPPPRRVATSKSSSTQFQDSIPSFLTDAQREQFDHQTSDLLRSLNSSVQSLSEAASLQHTTATRSLEKKYGRPSSLLFRWAAASDSDSDAGKSTEQLREEGLAKTQKDFRDGVLWYLSMKLKVAMEAQSGMIEKRVERERERGMSRLADVRNKDVRRRSSVGGDKSMVERDHEANGDIYGNVDLRGRDSYDPALDTSSQVQMQPDLPPDQLQLFESENAAIFAHFNSQLAAITTAEKSLLEISSLQQTLLSHLTVQGEQIGSLVENAEQTGEDLKRGNKELKRAGERGSTAKMVFWGTTGLCGFLIVWDLIF